MDCTNLSVISESVDYMTKFEQIAAEFKSTQDNNSDGNFELS